MTGDRTNIDAPTTEFVGRDEELHELREQFHQGRRLITILGTAGTGKTRLARETGLRATEDFEEGGVWFCDLSQAEDADDAAAEVAAVLGVDLEGAASLAERRDRIARALAARGRTLVVLDNFEQISDTSNQLVHPWLEATEEAYFLVTSRERLRLGAEYCYDLDPLSAREAVALFEARAGMAASQFELDDEVDETVEKLVGHLDCLPLAIELAASRIRALPPKEMLERISSRFRLLRSPHRDRQPRQKTLEQAIEWSWEMLDVAERSCLAQCSVFRGGFTVAFAEETIDLDSVEGDPWVVDVLEQLIDKSVLERNTTTERGRQPRITMFESIREFVERRVEEFTDPVELAERHARVYAAAGEDWLEQLEGDEASLHLEKLRDEQANLRAGFERHRDRRPALAFRIASVLQRVLRYGGSGEKHREVVQYMTDYAEKRSQKSSQVSTYRARAELRNYHGDLEGALEDFERALELFKRVDRPALRAQLLGKVAEIRRKRGEAEAALDELNRATELARRAARPGLVRKMLALRACSQVDAGDLDGALRTLGEADEYEAGANRRDECRTLNRLAYAHYFLENYERQRALQEQALEVASEVGDERLEGECIQGLGDAAYARGAYERAVDLYEEALDRHRQLGNRHAEGVLYGNAAAAFHRTDQLQQARSCYRKARSIHEETGAAPYRAATLHGMGVLAQERDQLAEAARMLQESSRLWSDIGRPRDGAAVDICRSLVELERGDADAAVQIAARAGETFEAHGADDFGAVARVCEALGALGGSASGTALGETLQDVWGDPPAEESSTRAFVAYVTAAYPDVPADGPDELEEADPNDLATGPRLYERSLRALAEHGGLPEARETAAGTATANDATKLRVGPEGTWIEFEEEEPVDLRRRGAIRRIIDALVEATCSGDQSGFDVYELFDVGWPDEEIAPDQASNRVYWAVSKIRELGFEGHLLTSDAGYYLDRSSLTIERSEREQPR